MLVLTRKYQEKIRIGNNITITVLRTKGKAVRLGIEAPSDVPVIRGELSFQHESEPESMPMPESLDEALSSKRVACAGGTATVARWETTRESDTKVRLSRVPRNKAAGMLPKLVGGPAPLRAMMDRTATR